MNGLKQKGITLIALVVTIVVLLVLAGVSLWHKKQRNNTKKLQN